MKKAFLLLFSLFTFLSFGQKINDYEFVMVPTKFDFQTSENEYRLNTILKFRLEEFGFNPIYTSQQLNTNYEDRCRYLSSNVIDNSGLLNTKLYIVFKDCNGKVIFQSATGMSKQKDRKVAYNEALELALVSVKNLNYKFTGIVKRGSIMSDQGESSVEVVGKEVLTNKDIISANTITNGFQLVDQAQKEVVKIFKTTLAAFFIATSEGKNGVVFNKNGHWFFEYYEDGNLISEQMNIKF